MVRFSQYNVVKHDKNNNLIVYNTKTAKFFCLDKEDLKNKFQEYMSNPQIMDISDNFVHNLYIRDFIVDDERDEYTEVKNEINNKLQESSKTLYLRLYVTENCNFRCTYCFEKHLNKRFNDDLWKAVYLYIKNSLSKNIFECIQIDFFGGEPLLEYNSMVTFLKKLKTLEKEYPDVVFTHNMITNGYLLTPEVYNTLRELSMEQIQITVDGFEEHHNKQRMLANGKGSWKKIIENLEYINKENDNVGILLRVNVDNELIKNIDEFKDWAYKKFDNQKIRFSFYPVVKFSKIVDDDLLYDINSSKSRKIITKLMYGDDRSDLGDILPTNRYSYCPMINPNFYSILSDGSLVKCEDDKQTDEAGCENVIVGHINEKGEMILNENLKICTEDMETEECKTCVVYPICCARGCPHKKAMSSLHGIERKDCIKAKENFRKTIEPFIEEELLDMSKRK